MWSTVSEIFANFLPNEKYSVHEGASTSNFPEEPSPRSSYKLGPSNFHGITHNVPKTRAETPHPRSVHLMLLLTAKRLCTHLHNNLGRKLMFAP